jgi:hypothetical protein
MAVPALKPSEHPTPDGLNRWWLDRQTNCPSEPRNYSAFEYLATMKGNQCGTLVVTRTVREVFCATISNLWGNPGDVETSPGPSLTDNGGYIAAYHTEFKDYVPEAIWCLTVTGKKEHRGLIDDAIYSSVLQKMAGEAQLKFKRNEWQEFDWDVTNVRKIFDRIALRVMSLSGLLLDFATDSGVERIWGKLGEYNPKKFCPHEELRVPLNRNSTIPRATEYAAQFSALAISELGVDPDTGKVRSWALRRFLEAIPELERKICLTDIKEDHISTYNEDDWKEIEQKERDTEVLLRKQAKAATQKQERTRTVG